MNKLLYRQPRQKTASQLRRHTTSVSELLDRGFFIFAGIAALWLGALFFIEGWSIEWSYWAYFVVFWAVLAYLGLPRLHRILSHIYVPDYFIGRTRTSDGLLGDPVNIGIRGTEAQLHEAMLTAGWVQADDITAFSSWRMLTAVLRKRSYPSAPVSSLFLFGRQQDFSYQKEVNGSPGKRHHVRFWHCPKGWLLPGGHQVDWLAAASYDASAGISWFTLQLTHRIDEDIDIERDFIVNSLTAANDKVAVHVVKDFSTGYHTRNGGGDMIVTDGDLPVISVQQIESTTELPQRPGLIFDGTLLSEEKEFITPIEFGDVLWRRRPLQLVVAAVLSSTVLVIELFSLLHQLMTSIPLNDVAILGMSVTGIGVVVAEVILMFFVLRGNNLARINLLLLASFFIVKTGVGFFLYHQPVALGDSLVSISLHIGLLLALTSDAARRFTRQSNRKKV